MTTVHISPQRLLRALVRNDPGLWMFPTTSETKAPIHSLQRIMINVSRCLSLSHPRTAEEGIGMDAPAWSLNTLSPGHGAQGCPCPGATIYSAGSQSNGRFWATPTDLAEPEVMGALRTGGHRPHTGWGAPAVPSEGPHWAPMTGRAQPAHV